MATDQERFEAKVDRSPGHGPWGNCHIWTAGLIGYGYGQFWLHGRPHYAHRVAWYFAHGRWPDPMALHRCNVTACVNLDHIYEGTHQENMADLRISGRRKGISSGPRRRDEHGNFVAA